MHRIVTAILGLLVSAACGGGAWAIDCKHARLPAQQVACSSPELLKVLAERDRAYEQTRARLKGKELAALATDERDWVKSYPKTCGVPAKGTLPTPIAKETVACFRRASEARITYLRQYGRAKPSNAAAAEPIPAAPAAEQAKEPPSAPPAAEKDSAALPAAEKGNATAPASPPVEPAKAEPPQPAAKPAPEPAAQQAPAPAPAPERAAAMPPPAPERAAAMPPPPAAEKTPAEPPAPAAGAAEYHVKFTFACGNPNELPKVLSSLAANDLAYPLSRPDCLPVPDGGKASLLSDSGRIAKIRMCTADVGCTDVYIDANSVLDPEGRPVAK